MNKRELEQRLVEIDAQLKALGDLNVLVQQSQGLPGLVSDTQTKKTTLETILGEIPIKKTELETLITDTKNLSEQVVTREEEVSALVIKVEELQEKVTQLIDQTKVQLGVAANAKLASTFEQVKTDLNIEKTKMFWWFVGVVSILALATALVVWWQVEESGTLYHLNFPVRIALLSPIVYFVVFINREYNRARNLIEEYTFKAAIARSFEAYREIVQGADSEDSAKTLDFILKSITDLYSSPMVNIKNNGGKEKENTPDMLSQIKETVQSIVQEK